MMEVEAESMVYELVGRTATRHRCHLKARYRVLSSMGICRDREVYEDGWLVNRSNGGVLLEAGHHFGQADRLELNFNAHDGGPSYRAEALVRWVKRKGVSTFHVGLQFEKCVQI